ncbi:MAG: hypothetical protein AAB393_18275 [Bacteroidota bacterium]
MKTWVIGVATLSLALFIAGCFAGSSIVKGYVVMRTSSEAHINLGSDDGIQLGDTLVVWREEKSGAPGGRTVRSGRVKVVRLLDKNHAAVEVLSGNLRERDRVEKQVR